MLDRRPGSPLRVARVRAGWGVGELAKAIGVPESTLWRIETEVIKEPRQGIRKALAKVLGVPASKPF
jgi:transcriptional regulator with XRE-family HTH domain